MRLLHRSSSWRALFADDAMPDPAAWPDVLAPLGAALERLGPHPDLAAAHAWQVELADALARLDLPAGRIAQLLSDHNDWLYRRAIEHSLAEMRAQGWGHRRWPSACWCWARGLATRACWPRTRTTP